MLWTSALEPEMITLDSVDLSIDRSIQERPGAFVWWYLDLVDDQGRNLVIIWSFGLPFLPGYVDAARHGEAQVPGARPSLNISLYDGKRAPLYFLQEYGAAEVSWQGASWRFGDTTIEVTQEAERVRLKITLDCALPGTHERLTGVVLAEGPSVRHAEHPAGTDAHRWTPLMGPAHGEADLRVGDRLNCQLKGEAYHDRNRSAAPWHKMGINWWLWGRVMLGDTLWIIYLLWPDSPDMAPEYKVLSVDRSGETQVFTDIAPLLTGRRVTTWGAPTWRHLRIDGLQPGLEITLDAPHDVSPFYLRMTTHARRGALEGRGSAEMCFPHRTDQPWFRPFVRMCVHSLTGPNSTWLPWFVGARVGRARRLLSSLWGSHRSYNNRRLTR